MINTDYKLETENKIGIFSAVGRRYKRKHKQTNKKLK